MDPSEKQMAESLRQRGYGIIPPDQYLIDIGDEFRGIWEQVNRYTMTSVERGFALYNAVRYIIENGIEGDFVECGVWKGGSCMIVALTLSSLAATDRRIWMYDTFDGMTEPCEKDCIAWNGKSVHEKWNSDHQGLTDNFTSWKVTLDQVRENIDLTGYPPENLDFIKGPVEKTLGMSVPERVALLRLDTDWYESTKAELESLYPVISSGGVLIIDDYGHFTGARAAVDEYFKNTKRPVLLNRIDYTGRIGIKF